MEKASTDYVYIIPDGSTEEQKLTPEDVVLRLERGILSPDSLVYDEKGGIWLKLSDKEEFASAIAKRPLPADPAGGGAPGENEELEEKYREALADLEVEPDSFDLLVKAGRLALGLGLREEAFGHYQRLLFLDPFNPRAAAEIKRSFSPREYSRFELLQRKPPFWENLDEWGAFLAGGRMLLLPAMVLAAGLSFIPRAGWLVWVLTGLVTLYATGAAADGSALSPAGLADPRRLKKLCRSSVLTGLAGAELLLPFVLSAAVGMLIERSGDWNPLAALAGSPAMQVFLFAAASVYVPFVVAVSVLDGVVAKKVLDPREVLATMPAVGEEYVWSAVTTAAGSLAWLLFSTLVGGIPVLGGILSACSLPLVAASFGFVLGRMGSRHAHVVSPPQLPSSERARSSSEV